MSLLTDHIVDSKCWWPTHLGESARSEDGDVYDYLDDAFGVDADAMNRFWKQELNLDDPGGRWPQFQLSIPGHSLSVVYFGNPRCDVEFRHSGPTGLTTVWAVCGGNFMRPGFRWDEIETFSRLIQTSEDVSLLLLLPAADISRRDQGRAKAKILRCFEAQGISGPGIERFAVDLVNGLTWESNWHYDAEFGWLTDNIGCWRCRDRPAKGLDNPTDSAFRELKSMTDYLEQTE